VCFSKRKKIIQLQGCQICLLSFQAHFRLLIPMACTSFGLKPSWPWNKNQISGLKVKKGEKSTRNIFWIATRLGLRIGEFKKIIFFFFDSD